jgi:hypothetical protein
MIILLTGLGIQRRASLYEYVYTYIAVKEQAEPAKEYKEELKSGVDVIFFAG